MAAVTADQLAALAESLTKAVADAEKTSKHLKRHIEAEGLKIGTQLGKSHAMAAQDQIATKDAELRAVAFDLMRASDCIVELRRQMKVLERRSEKYYAVERAVRDACRTALPTGNASIEIRVLLDIINAPTNLTTIETS